MNSAGRQPRTTRFVVTYKEGNAIGATQTIGDIFKSKVRLEGTGIWRDDPSAGLASSPRVTSSTSTPAARASTGQPRRS